MGRGVYFHNGQKASVNMLYHQTLALSKRGNLERHHNTNHDTFERSSRPKNTIHQGKVEELKLGLKAQQKWPGRVEAISEDVDPQVLKDFFSLQLEESLDVKDTARLVVFVKMAFPDSTTKEDSLLFCTWRRERGIRIFTTSLQSMSTIMTN